MLNVAESTDPSSAKNSNRDIDPLVGTANTTTGKSNRCAHCQLPLVSDQTVYAGKLAFCCGGCSTAYQWLHSEGLEHFYDLQRRFSDSATPVGQVASEDQFTELDDSLFWQQYIKPLPGGLVEVTLYLQGVHCAACVWLVERLPRLVPGVESALVNLPRSTVRLVWNPSDVRLSAIAVGLARLGYQAVPLRGSAALERRTKSERQQLIQLGIAFACAGNVMLFAIALYAGAYTGMAIEHEHLLRSASTIVGLVALLGPGSVFFRGAWASIVSRTPHMDLPVALGLAVGALSGIWNTLRGSGELYFDSLAMLVFLLLGGRWLLARKQHSALDSIELLLQLTPRTARRVRDGEVKQVPVASLQAGDTVEVPAGEIIPVDGRIIWGQSDIDQSWLTGESIPIAVTDGSEVLAGTVNRTASIRINAQCVGAETRIGRLVETIEQAASERTPLVQLADRIGGWFVVVVMLLALGTGIYWWPRIGGGTADHIVALLIVACPCALGLATPLAITMALGRSAKQGLLVKGGDALQRLGTPGILLLDKTGTVTAGSLEISNWNDNYSLLEEVATLQSHSQHPIAKAIRDAYDSKKSLLVAQTDPRSEPALIVGRNTHLEATDVVYQAGGGISGKVQGKALKIGSISYMRQHNILLNADVEADIEKILESGESPLLIACEGVHIKTIGIRDAIRPETAPMVAELIKRGWQIGLLSGDHPHVVQQVGQRIGITADMLFGGCSPEQKLEQIRRWKETGKTIVMVGDGVNDAAALALADVGIAVHGGAEVSLQAAAIYLGNSGLSKLVPLFEASRRTLNLIYCNFAASLGYNVLAVTLAMVGWIHPLAAAVLMPISSLTVVTLTYSAVLYPQSKPRLSSTSTLPSQEAMA